MGQRALLGASLLFLAAVGTTAKVSKYAGTVAEWLPSWQAKPKSHGHATIMREPRFVLKSC